MIVGIITGGRAKIKKYIDRFSNSEISKVKSHGNY